MPGRRRLFAHRRITLGFSQEQLAEELGVDRSTIVRWEAGSTNPQPSQRPRLAQLFGVDVAEIDRLLAEPVPVTPSGPRRRGRTDRLALVQPNAAVGGVGDDGVGDGMNRRDFMGLAGGTVAGALLNDGASLRRLAQALSPLRGAIVDPEGSLELEALYAAYINAGQAWQHSRYDQMAKLLPNLLDRLHAAEELAEDDEAQRLGSLTAFTYTSVAGFLRKLEQHELQAIAADRSMQAARRSEDPVAIATSARCVGYALIKAGQFETAKDLLSLMAADMDASVQTPTPESLTAYGMLVLRGAIAAGEQGDQDTARTLMSEAEQAALRLGGDRNYFFTAFGPTNVLVHRLLVEVTLGNAGNAISTAQAIEIDRLPVERRASVYIDTARAYTQWSKYDDAIATLWQAEADAPQELRVRPTVMNLVRQIAMHGPPSARRQTDRLTERLGLVA